MKRTIQLIAALLLVTLLAGCGGEGETVEIGSTFIGGTDGLEMSLREGMPPAEVWDANTYPFDISIDVENKGEWDVNKSDVKVQLAGFNPTVFGVNESSIVKASPEDLVGLSRDSQGNIIPSTKTSIDFSGFSYQDTLASDEQYNILADICYSYGTKATSKICVIQDLRLDNSRVCTVSESKEIKNSGAPVQVIEVKESAAGADQIQVTFKVQNQGTGDVYQAASGCPQEMTARLKNKDQVFVKVDSGLSVQPKCSGLKDVNGVATPDVNSGYVKLTNGEAIVSCRQQATTTSDFEQLVNLELEYDYAQSVQQTLLVKRSS